MKNLIKLFKPVKNSSYNIILQMKFFASIAAANALQVSSKSLAKLALEAAQPEKDSIGGIINVDGADIDWELNWGVRYDYGPESADF